LILFSSALEFNVKKNIMNNLIIDAANDKILFKIITNNESYTTDYPNSRENFDKFILLLLNFLKEKNIKIQEINNIFINQGPGKFSGIRTSISVAKALAVFNKTNIYGFNNDQIKENKYNKILELYAKGELIKNLIIPKYSS
tara:strand:- start:1120 stop:1545 length:426 start_codon:yes stop_codon:yes gene_type:complete